MKDNRHKIKEWTIKRIVWGHNGDVKELIDIGLEPMTLREASTMRQKQINALDWLICKLNTL